MELNITEANSNYMIVNANRLRGKGYEYTMGKATFINETTAELYGSIGFPSEGALAVSYTHLTLPTNSRV